MLLSRSARLLRLARPRSTAPAAAYSNSITYSGGQASNGQGGFYGARLRGSYSRRSKH